MVEFNEKSEHKVLINILLYKMSLMKNNSDLNILIVDDEIINIKIASVLLQREGYKVYYTTKPLNVINNVEHNDINLILLDIDMPQKNGFEVCEDLKKNENTKDIPVIFLTAQTNIEYITRAFKVGGIDYIFKPFNPIELRIRIETHLKIVSYVDEIKDKQFKLANFTITDPLTKLNNSLYFDTLIMKNLKNDTKFWFILFKIDKLERLNQLYGLFGADKVIKKFAELIKEESSPDFVVARLHGGSIGVIIHTSDKKQIVEFYKSIVFKMHKDEFLSNKISFYTVLYHVQHSNISLAQLYKKVTNSMYSLQNSNEHKYLILQ